MSIPPGTPSPVPGSGPVPPQGTPPPQTAAPNKLELYKKILNAVDRLNLTEKTISGMTAKPLDKGAKIELVNKVVQLAIDSNIAANEMESLIATGDLDLQTFIDNEALIDTYRNSVAVALQNLQNSGVMGVPGISRETILKLVSLAFKAEVMHVKGAVVPTPEGNFIVRLKKGKGKVYIIPNANMEMLGRGAYSTAFKTNDLMASTPLVFKEAMPKNPAKFQNAIEGQLQERLVLKEIHSGGNKTGVTPPPHAVIGIIGGRGGQPVAAAQGMRPALLVNNYDRGDFQSLIEQWDIEWEAGNAHMQERVEMCARLLDGLVAVHEAGRNHGDIKPQNVLCKTENGMVVGDLADFDTSLSIEELAKHLKDPDFVPWGKFTSQFVCHDDLTYERDAAGLNPSKPGQSRRQPNPDLLHEYQKRRDVFSLGMTLFTALTGYMAFGQTVKQGGEFADVSDDSYKNIITDIFDPNSGYDPNLSIELNEFFDTMLMADLEYRYSAVDARDDFKNLMGKYHFW